MSESRSSESRNTYNYSSRHSSYSNESRGSSESRDSYNRQNYSSESHFKETSRNLKQTNENDTIDKLIDRYRRGDITGSELGELIQKETNKSGDER